MHTTNTHTHTHSPISLAYKKCRNNETKYQYKKLLVRKKITLTIDGGKHSTL